jgi:hypothetical protein
VTGGRPTMPHEGDETARVIWKKSGAEVGPRQRRSGAAARWCLGGAEAIRDIPVLAWPDERWCRGSGPGGPRGPGGGGLKDNRGGGKGGQQNR